MRDHHVRLGLCLVLDGHHKLKAAANTGTAVTVLCFGLQGEVMNPHRPPIRTLMCDSEAIFLSL